MLGDENEALAGLRRTEAALTEYCEQRALVLRREQPWPGAPGPEEQPGPIKHAVWALAGAFPGGAVGRLRHQAVFGSVIGQEVAGQHTIMVCRIPESVGYVPMLCCRPDELMSGMYYWGGDQRPRASARFESAELERRYLVEVAKGQSQSWLFQLFSPTFIDWLARETPVDFGFKLDLGVFTSETPQWRAEGGQAPSGELDPERLDLLASCGGRAAARIRDEVLEEAPPRGEPAAVDSAEAYARWALGPKHGRVVKAILWAADRLGGGGSDDGTAAFAAARGMESESPARFHARYIGLAMPGAATAVATGALPGGERPGSLAWLEFTSELDVEHECVALATAIEGLPTAWVDPADAGVPGFADGAPAALVDAAADAGYGLATSPRFACLYMRTSGTVPGAEIDAFSARAQRILDLVGPLT